MSFLLFLLAGVLAWLGVDALLLARHPSPPTQVERDDMMFGAGHERPIPEYRRAFNERRYPFATSFSMRIYGLLFIAAAVVIAGIGWSTRG